MDVYLTEELERVMDADDLSMEGDSKATMFESWLHGSLVSAIGFYNTV